MTRRVGCGCCSHCRCTGTCVDREPEHVERQKTPRPSPPPSPPPVRRVPPPPVSASSTLDVPLSPTGPAGPADGSLKLLSVIESLPHPNDLIMGRRSHRSRPPSPDALTPTTFGPQMSRSQQAGIGSLLSFDSTHKSSSGHAHPRAPLSVDVSASHDVELRSHTPLHRAPSRKTTPISEKRSDSTNASIAQRSPDRHKGSGEKAKSRNPSRMPSSNNDEADVDHAHPSRSSRKDSRHRVDVETLHRSPRKHSKMSTLHPTPPDKEQMGDIEVRTWAPTPVLGSFVKPKTRRELDEKSESDIITDSEDDEYEKERQRRTATKKSKLRNGSRKKYESSESEESEDDDDDDESDDDDDEQARRRHKKEKDRSHREREERAREKEEKRKHDADERRQREKKELRRKEREEHRQREREQEEERRKNEKEARKALKEEIKTKLRRKDSKREMRSRGDSDKEEGQATQRTTPTSVDSSPPAYISRAPSPMIDSRQGETDPKSISIGGFTLSRTRSRSSKPPKGDAGLASLSVRPPLSHKESYDRSTDTASAESKRERLLNYIDSVVASAVGETTKDKQFSRLNAKNETGSLKSHSSKHSPPPYKTPPSRQVSGPFAQIPALNTVQAISKLVVRHCTTQTNTIHFFDMSRFDDDGGPLVAFRLECVGLVDAAGAKLKPVTHPLGWLAESLENGSKVRGELRLAVGRKGPALFDIGVKRRHVDKFVIHGAKEQSTLVKFADAPHWGEHDDYRHLYCRSPKSKTLKWYVQEPGKLMRLFGRGDDDYGHIYAEARTTGGASHNVAISNEKRSKRQHAPPAAPKEATLLFYPSKGEQANGDGTDKEAKFFETAFACATWWCARQTFEEGQMAAAHAEIEMIETIEKAFEVDLLAGA